MKTYDKSLSSQVETMPNGNHQFILVSVESDWKNWIVRDDLQSLKDRVSLSFKRADCQLVENVVRSIWASCVSSTW